MTPTNDAPVAVEQGQRWQHINRGTAYEVLGVAELQAAQPQMEHAALVIYRGDDGKLWARNSAEFTDGRFRLAALASAPAGDGVISLADALAIVDRCTPAAAGHPSSHTNSMRCIASDIRKGIAALARPRAAVGEREKLKAEPQAWGDIECSGCTLPRRDCECN